MREQGSNKNKSHFSPSNQKGTLRKRSGHVEKRSFRCREMPTIGTLNLCPGEGPYLEPRL